MTNIYEIKFTNNDGETDYTQLNANNEEEVVGLLWSMEKEYDLASIDEIELVGYVRYYICAIGYNKLDKVTDFDRDFGCFDTEDDAQKKFSEVLKDAYEKNEKFFENTDESVWYWKLQLEMCEEEEDIVQCVDVISEEDIFRVEIETIPELFGLSDEEANAIDHIMSITKMDCWFCLIDEKDGAYYVRDLENGTNMRLDQALSEALDGFDDLESLGATEKEIELLTGVLIRIGVIDDTNPDKNVWG